MWPLQLSDLDKLRALHESYYKDEFSFPDFQRNFLSTFKIIDESGNIISAGGVKLFPEIILITDQARTDRLKYDSRMDLLRLGQFTARSAGHDLLYTAVSPNLEWEKILIKLGFRASLGHEYVIG